MIYKELDIDIDHDYLLNIFNQHKETELKPFKTEDTEYGYYEMPFNFDGDESDIENRGKKYFFDQFPYVCKGYQYVYIPPKYEMLIHTDIGDVAYRIGCKLKGSAELLFYKQVSTYEYKLIDSYDYKKPVFLNTQIPHNVKNNNEERLTFFVNFTQRHYEPYKSFLEL